MRTFNKSGISPIIATILLVGLCIGLSSSVYLYASSMVVETENTLMPKSIIVVNDNNDLLLVKYTDKDLTWDKVKVSGTATGTANLPLPTGDLEAGDTIDISGCSGGTIILTYDNQFVIGDWDLP